jgi:hypothetical protein
VLIDEYQHRSYSKGALHDGAIWKKGGLQIKYDLGEGAHNKNESPAAIEVDWTVKQNINGRDLEVVKDKNGLVMACYTAKEMEQTKSYPAIFSAAVKSEQQLAEFLVIVVTYPAPLEESPPAENEIPRRKLLENLQIIDGYKHERLQGTDSKTGRIMKNDWEIKYDIGRAAGARASRIEKDTVVFSIKQAVSQYPVEIVKDNANQLTVTFTRNAADLDRSFMGPYPANFWGKIASEEKLVDFLLMTLTYPASKPNTP